MTQHSRHSSPATGRPGKWWRALAGWLCLVAGILLCLWTVLAGVIAIPPPAWVSIRLGAGLALALCGHGILGGRKGPLLLALLCVLASGVGWLVLP